MQRDELHLFVLFGFREEAAQQNARASEGQADDQGETDQNRAQDDDVHQKISEIVLLVEICVLVPRDIGVVIYGAEQSLGFPFCVRPSGDRNDRPSPMRSRGTRWPPMKCCRG